MAPPRLSDAVLRETMTVLANCDGNQMAAAKQLGISRGAMQSRISRANARGLQAGKSAPELPEFPDDDVPVGELIDTMERRFSKRHAHDEAKKWFPVKMPEARPIGLAFMGDPHVDDNGCNWPLLRRHCEIMRQDGIYAVNIGDTTNNWTGRLLKKFADQDTSQATARKLAKWLLTDAGIQWLLWLFGNHDGWNDGAAVLSAMNVQRIVMIDWQAQFRLCFPNGWDCRVWAAHQFPGHSMWNTLHGPQRAAHTKDWAHIYACGHTHNWAAHHEESASRDFVYWLARCRGYKFLDEYADKYGHQSQRFGATVLAVIDPNAEQEVNRVHCFADLELGADFLKYLRRKAK